MWTADDMASRPRASEPADIPLRDLPQLPGTIALPSGQELYPGTRSIYDSRFGDLDTGPVVPNTELTRPGQSSVVHCLARLTKFWTTKVRCTVDFAACRDHLAVERTFLGYLRTSTVLAMLGTLVAQLFTINAQDHGPNSSLLGKPLATIFFTLAIVTVGLGAIRNYRHQSFLIEGKALAGGVEIHILSLLSLLVLVVCLGITLGTEAPPIDTAT
ncbi:hypothetical protein CC79DRAFT_1363683 [Sarocladium strictum]